MQWPRKSTGHGNVHAQKVLEGFEAKKRPQDERP